MKKVGVEKDPYLPEAKAKKLQHRLFRNRRLSITEEGDMYLVFGDNRKAIAAMTPKRLKEIADWCDGKLLGC